MVSPRGGGHTRGAALEGRLQNIDEQTARRYFGIPGIGGPTDYENKERLVYFFERLGGFLDCAGICVFTNSLRLDMMLPEDYARLLSVATGEEFKLEDILRIGERAHNLEKVYNLLNTDWGKREDMPPARFVEVPLDGRCRIDLQAWDRMLDRYYQLHGWDSEGRPTKEGLRKLGMDEISDMLGASGR
jgi:aldehyde:ferredoxin oxidoreductase